MSGAVISRNLARAGTLDRGVWQDLSSALSFGWPVGIPRLPAV